MPVPASDAIASDVGHGALGIRYGLRPFRDLLGETVGQRHLWVELRPKKVLPSNGWTLSGSMYYQAVGATIDGVPAAVVGVRTLTETLAHGRPETTLAAGQWAVTVPGGSWASHNVWVRLTGDANPASTIVVVELAVSVGSHGVVQPILGQDMLANGDFEAWTGTALDGWTLVNSDANIAEAKTTSDPLRGSYAARFTGTAATAWEAWYQDVDVIAGLTYRLSGAYRHSNAELVPELTIHHVSDSVFMQLNGRDATLAPATILGERVETPDWRRFIFDFQVPAPWTTVRVTFYAAVKSGTQTGTIDLDDFRFQNIQRYAYHEPLLSAESLPTIEAARSDSFWGEMSSALGSLSLLNGGGRLEPLIAAYDWLGADAIVRVGGRFQLGGNETLIEDCPIIATGKLGAPVVTDSLVTFDMEDDRKLLQRTLPLNTYNDLGPMVAQAQVDKGRSRPLLFGTKTAMRPVRTDKRGSGDGDRLGLGIYEIADMTDAYSGAGSKLGIVTGVVSYIDETAATKRDSQRGKTFGNPSGLDDTTGLFSVNEDIRIIEVVAGKNDYLDISMAGVPYAAVITPRLYWWADAFLGNEIRDALNAAVPGSPFLSPAYSLDTGGKVTVSSSSAFAILTGTGANRSRSLWPALGFTSSADVGAATDQTSDTGMFVDCDSQHILRWNGKGFKDDVSGTYTGSASAAIEKAPDIARFLLRVILGVPASAIDVPSFVAARAVATRPCSLYIGAQRTVGDIFAELETSGNMDLVLIGGVWYCWPRDATTPAGTVSLVDADFLSFESFYVAEDLYGKVKLAYNESADGSDVVGTGGGPRRRISAGPGRSGSTTSHEGPVWTGVVTNASVALRHDRPDQQTFGTCLRDTADATTGSPNRLTEIATQASTKRRRFRFSTKGKALQVPVNGKLLLTRAKGLDTTGALSQLLVRVLSKRDDWARWVSDVEAIEVV